jgi:hypothetical protein
LFNDLSPDIQKKIHAMLERKQFKRARRLYLDVHMTHKIDEHNMVVRLDDLSVAEKEG